ncbi:Calcineurin-like phosphoesterase superfamily protein [Desulfuromusa kysingii]|uniref:Calcineurin-like phosphoesterase superfamily protein n=1 Tax=Desulfuromusa kysingii TaxID=37625 RepID=A0A1H3YX74_9BACT|nr:hypothetical protein [Desulfuromusa kysingii]SEA16165.1 Calcineurin-like phosphoesterase superfamily protein [Desulfuromusa kysingii]
MKEIFLTADHHFGHHKILQYEEKRGVRFSSIEEHDEFLIEQWNAVVRPVDTVYHLGDLAFGHQGFNVARRLNGYKKLILGNHDILDTQDYLQVFAKLHGSLFFKGTALLSHIPVHPQQLNSRYLFNVHGHMHGRAGIEDKRYIDIGVDAWDFKPVAWSDLKKVMEERL